MINKTKITAKKFLRVTGIIKSKELKRQDVVEALEYIEKYWKNLERFHHKYDESLLGLPKPYLVPA